MRRPATRIVFDLDGTLVQTRIASWQVFREVQAEFGLGLDSPEKFYSCFQGNFFDSLRRLVGDSKVADAVMARFFERLEQDYHPAPIPGITGVARALASRSTLAVLSSNATSVIRRILTENGLQFCFSHVFGGDVEPDKSAGLRRFLEDAAQGVGRRCAAPYDEGGTDISATAADTVLVTDTVGDVEAGVRAGVRVVGVSWGMHSPEELREAGAEFIAVWPQELVSYLQPDASGASGGATCGTCELAGSFVACGPQPVRLPMPVLDVESSISTLPPSSPSGPVGVRRSRRLASVTQSTHGSQTAESPVGGRGCPAGSAESRPAVRVPHADLAEVRDAMRDLVGLRD